MPRFRKLRLFWPGGALWDRLHQRLLPRASTRDLDRLADHMASLLEAGLPVQQAVHHLRQHPVTKTQKLWLESAAAAVEEGRSLADGWQSMAPALLQTLLTAGERSGHVAKALRAWSQHVQQRRRVVSEWVRLVSYPAVLLVLMCGLLVFVSRVVLPMFVSVYGSLGLRLSGPTRTVADILTLLPDAVGVGAALVVAGAGLAIVLRSCLPAAWARLRPSLPGARWIRLSKTRTVAQLLNLLLGAGIALTDALAGLAQADGPRWLRDAAHRSSGRVLEGYPVAQVFEGDWDPLLGVLLSWAEQTGELESAFRRVETYTAQMLSTRLKRVVQTLEPTLLVLMGLLVTASMYIVYVPMYDMMTAISNGQVHA
ncbi:type II secretion system F family protein [Alicyclobacillus cycloheptanicus]|jgi:type II secretory pathway component PulF|uniref:Type II secretory pathway component PulF n=1 Tax=Alicyclobacillus cycloheptanicus TaxID=1457 RepID=A0ABT9XDG1_9BACL|nr:type II secretion system F family protein [Alicyclobacillus cycloheptanicus]MDQ0188332.1 type II secretory pathway component PulF [Alicyclobacillus cycloheptanicus]WDM01046.1 type II secretion system F family protein [Alicyclobacillus cycloheptanicus]